MNKRELEYIRASWKKHLDNPPFQYCDHFCEECRYTFCCSIYYDEKKRRLKVLRKGKNPDDPKVAVEQIKDCFSESFKAFKKMAKQDGFDLNLEEFKKDAPKFSGRSPEKSRICREAERWAKKSLRIIDELAKEEDDTVLLLLYNKLSKFEHYALMVPSKIFRAMLFFYEEDPDSEGAYDDAARSAALALRSLGFCSNVIHSVVNIKMREIGCSCAEVISLAAKLESQLRKKFSDVDSYKSKIIFNSL